MSTPTSLEHIARDAIDGDREALNTLVGALQHDIFGLALRMLWNREDAEDATQDILVRIVTHLSQFNFESRLKTWAYRIAVNCILDGKKSATERLNHRFARFAEHLVEGFEPASVGETERSLLLEEVKVGCTMAMLQCLDRPHRMAYVLGEIMELSGPEAADALDISADLFRKRLQQARQAIVDFTRGHCGLVSDTAACQCNRHVSVAAAEHAGSQPLQFAKDATSFQDMRAMVRRVDEVRWEAQLHRSNRPREASIDFAQRILAAIKVAED